MDFLTQIFTGDAFSTLQLTSAINANPHVPGRVGRLDVCGGVVCRRAAELGAAALVMASHTKSKLQEFFLGSVTNSCCHHCGCPVLVVK